MSGTAVGIAIGVVVAIGAGITTAVYRYGRRAQPRNEQPIIYADVTDWPDEDPDGADAAAAMIHRSGER